MSETKIARFHKRAYAVHILCCPGDETPKTRYPVEARLDDQCRTVWEFRLADEEALWMFLQDCMGKIRSTKPWIIYAINGKGIWRRQRINVRSLMYTANGDLLARWMGKWTMLYPHAERAKLIQLIIQGKHAGLPLDKIDYRRVAADRHEKYQLLQNKHAQTERFNAELLKRLEQARPPSAPGQYYNNAMRLLVTQFILMNYQRRLPIPGIPASRTRNRSSIRFAIGERYDNGTSPEELVRSLTYYRDDGQAAVSAYRHRVTEQFATMGKSTLGLYVYSDSHPLSMVLPHDHDRLGAYARMVPPLN